MNRMPYGADTLVIPFEFVGMGAAPRVARMSRLRPRGKLFRWGVVRPEKDGRGEDAEGLLVPVQSRRGGGGGGSLRQMPGGGFRELTPGQKLLL